MEMRCRQICRPPLRSSFTSCLRYHDERPALLSIYRGTDIVWTCRASSCCCPSEIHRPKSPCAAASHCCCLRRLEEARSRNIRIVTYVFSIPGWTYDDVRDFKGTKVCHSLSLSYSILLTSSLGLQVYLYSPPPSN